jgi:ClpP class serine protease
MDADLRALTSRPWAIDPAHGCAFVESLADIVRARSAGAAPKPRAEVVSASDVAGVRTLSMSGPMLFKPPAWLAEWGIDYTDTLALTDKLKQADADPSVKSIVIDADTPGGMVGGVPELGDAIAGMKKRVDVRVDGMLASAGVWAASQADSISATRSSEIGSIGVYTVRVDTSQALADRGIKVYLISSGGTKGGGADGKVTPDMLAEDARIIGQLRDQFVSAVNTGRGRDLSSRATGAMWLAGDAQRIGLIDTVTQAGSPVTEEPAMDLAPIAALAASHPTKAGEILALAAAGKTDAEIAAHLAEATRADEVAAAKAATAEATARADKLAAELKTEQDAKTALAAELETVKAALSAAGKSKSDLEALRLGAAADPGTDITASSKLTKEQFAALTPDARAAHIARHGVDSITK